MTSEKLLQLILDSFPETIFIKDRQSVYLGCSTEFARDAGLKNPKEIVGKTDHDLPWKKEETEFFIEIDKRVMESGSAEIGIVEPMLKSDQKEYWVETNKVPLLNDSDEIIGILGSFKDITERVEADRELKKYAKGLDDELEQFASIASHDLQEPLKTMTSLLDYLEESLPDNLDQQSTEILKKVQESSHRMQVMIQGLLDYTRIGYNKIVEKLDCAEIVATVLSDLEFMIEEANATITVGEMPTIEGGRVEIQCLFQNLISNAIKFRNPEIAPIVEITAQKNGNWDIFKISDNGIGIETKFRKKVFKMYQRLNKRSEYKGSGIGLAHCKKIVDLHKGKIWFEEKINGGTSIKFQLPSYGNTN